MSTNAPPDECVSHCHLRLVAASIPAGMGEKTRDSPEMPSQGLAPDLLKNVTILPNMHRGGLKRPP
jgi:hypothetical protein